MLIKIDDSSQEFESAILMLKRRFNEKTGSKAAAKAILNYEELKEACYRQNDKIRRLESELDEIKNLIIEKNSIAERLKDIIDI